MLKHIKKVASYAAVGGFGAVIAAGLAGCGSDLPAPVTGESAR